MGSWGVASFENDVAADWFLLVEEAADPGVVMASAIDDALSAADNLEDDVSCEAIAAAALCACCAGQRLGAPCPRVASGRRKPPGKRSPFLAPQAARRCGPRTYSPRNRARVGPPANRSAANDPVEAELCGAQPWLPLRRPSSHETATTASSSPRAEGEVSPSPGIRTLIAGAS